MTLKAVGSAVFFSFTLAFTVWTVIHPDAVPKSVLLGMIALCMIVLAMTFRRSGR